MEIRLQRHVERILDKGQLIVDAVRNLTPELTSDIAQVQTFDGAG